MVDVDDLIQQVHSGQLVMGAYTLMRAMDAVGQSRRQSVGDQRGLAGTADAGDHGQCAQLDFDVDSLEVVLTGCLDGDVALARPAPLAGDDYAAPTREVVGSQRVLGLEDLRRAAGCHDGAAVLAGAGADV